MKVLYVGNLPFTSTEEEVREMYSQFGPVNSVKIIKDKETGKSRGFAFVELEDDAALKAIEDTNGKDCNGRSLRVNEAREKREGGDAPRREFKDR